MTNKEFFDKIIISEEEKEKANFYLKYRGIYEHEHVREYLEGFKKDKVTYSEIATTFRYDKKIRRILFKYIGFVEEYIRAIICENFQDLETIKTNKLVFEKLKKYDDIYTALNEILFSELIEIMNKNIVNIKEHFKNHSKKNMKALCTLRNKVFHNVFILGYINYDECDVDGVKSSSFRDNVLNLRQLLPFDEMKNNFDAEIKEAKQPNENKYESQVEWRLLNEITLEI